MHLVSAICVRDLRQSRWMEIRTGGSCVSESDCTRRQVTVQRLSCMLDVRTCASRAGWRYGPEGAA